jgi:hypothetical protein
VAVADASEDSDSEEEEEEEAEEVVEEIPMVESDTEDEQEEGGFFAQYNWGRLKKIMAEPEEEPETIPTDGARPEGGWEDAPVAVVEVKVKSDWGRWERHTKGIGLKLLGLMGYQAGMGLGPRGQGRVDPIAAHAEIANAGNLSVDYHTNPDLRRQIEAGDIDKEGKKQRKKRMKRNLVDMPTSHGQYKLEEQTGAFGLLNNMTVRKFDSVEDLAKEAQGSMDFAPDQVAPGPALPEAPADKASGKLAGKTGKGHVSDMFVMEQELTAARHKVAQLKQQFVRHRLDIQSGPIFKASLANAQAQLAQLETQMRRLVGSYQNEKLKKSQSKKIF